MLPTLLMIILIVFFILHMMPNTLGRIILGIQASQEQVDQLNESLGYNDPLPVQYARYLWNAVHGDFGESYQFGRPVYDILLPKFPTTLKLAFFAMAVACTLGVPIGVLAAVKKYSAADMLVAVTGLFFASIPTIFLGILMMLLFSLRLEWLPSNAIGGFRNYIMPVLSLSLPSMAFISRMTRSTMLDVISQDYIQTARAKGCGPMRIIFCHELRNAMMPVVTALTFAESFDPHTANEFDRMVVNSVLDTLFMYDENGDPAPCLAESWTEDGLDITVTLRQGVKFHDGADFNADAVLKNYEYELAGEYGTLFPTYVANITKVDDYTVVITKATTYASVLDYCCSYFYMVSPAAYDADPEGFAVHPVGTGAYVFDHKDEATGYVYLTANEDYFQGAPAFKNLEVHTALIAMENGELDLYLTPSNADFEIALENDALKTGTTTGWTQMTLVTFGEPYISDPNLRKAIMYAVNAENAAIYYGMRRVHHGRLRRFHRNAVLRSREGRRVSGSVQLQRRDAGDQRHRAGRAGGRVYRL